MSNANFSHCKPALCTIVKLHKIRLLKCTYYRHVGGGEVGRGVPPPPRFWPLPYYVPSRSITTCPPRFSDLEDFLITYNARAASWGLPVGLS